MVEKLIDKAIACGLIKQAQADIYKYGMEDFLYNLLAWGSFLIIGIIINATVFMLLFMLSYVIFRVFAGGFHCKTRTRCFLLSLAIIVTVFALPRLFSVQLLANIVLWLFVPVFLITYFLAPVEDLRKPLNKLECSNFKKLAIIVCLLEEFSAIIFFAFAGYIATYIIGAATIAVSLQLLAGKAKNRIMQS